MTAYAVPSGKKGAHHVLVANTEDVVTFSADHSQIELLLRDGNGEVYFTVDNTAATVGGTNCLVMPVGIGSAIVDVPATGGTVVRLVSSGTPAYSVSSTS